ncbi:MAG: hypothetical protein ACD_55C00127G0003 [uncultured bacterium]|uniref:Molybdopterin synthase catalytic subunit n=1 Tax=Geobacter sulfurreducens (strain ATCC 51573 / DSM 12127 / PCA) TaxID=243231 RepID=Q749P3_GEOSL|nr:molybdenum cofactor biosynthesis protein MoaE [Geobacter sulfurreducens]EKD59174.1 MAG: hypothetical protein ACD_55C00127G0003 [uncultured bacterium]AAR36071.1 molybdopterin synthase, large subunit [Geobacter sulfurreducens PCA]AJY68988.1 molybdopterin synthase [Geobacter sulfurreducens]UAC03393.1 molybdenum cofactor biosynthesis protein MoaE [Geobacter sulfurreducens]BBA71130.1 Molybdopterin synthase catalytic subunit [Geobacter sulfurreducens]
MVIITDTPIDPTSAYGLLSKGTSGSIVLHYAVVKQDAGNSAPTACIDYRFDAGAIEELEAISAELRQQWQLEDVLLIRREGCLGVGEIISLAAASSPNSEDAFSACRHGIARLKKMSTVHKREKFVE